MKYEAISKYIGVGGRKKNNVALSENNSNEESKTGTVAIQIILTIDTYLTYHE